MQILNSTCIKKTHSFIEIIVISICVLAVLGNKYSYQSNSDLKVQIGYSSVAFQDIPAVDASAAISVYVDTFRDHIQNRLHKQIKFYSKIYNSVNEMNNALNNKNVDLLSISMENYYQLRKTANISPCLAVTGNESDFEQYCLLARNEFVSNDFNSLKGKSMAIPKPEYHPMLEDWIYNFLMKNRLPDINKTFSKTIITQDEQSAIYSIFFKKADLTVVRKSVWDVASELNPQLKNSLTVLALSNPMLLIFTVSNDKSDQSIIKIVIDEGLILDRSPGGKNILNIFKAKRTIRITEADLHNGIQLINENNQYRAQSQKLKNK